jgi:rhodanese-related sulfurtransferase
VKSALVEALLVAVAGAILAFSANALSPHGLRLSHNYFPGGSPPAETVTAPVPGAKGTNAAPSADELLAARLKEKGLQLIDGNRALELFNDPRRAMGLVVFVDARSNEQHYREGHIPGAYHFDNSRYQELLPSFVAVCAQAQLVVVYCTGGQCEESENVAITLRYANVAAEKLLVYGGGITEWTARKLPIETGARESGQIQNAAK